MRVSITTKITIWYTVFLLIITGCFFAVIINTGNLRASELAKTKLMDSVADASEEIEAIGEKFIIDSDLSFYDDGVYLSVYDESGALIEGRRPAELSILPRLKDKSMKRLEGDDGEVWYSYDSLFNIGEKPIWVRGVVKDFAQNSAFSFMIKIFAVALPTFVILTALGGYIIMKRGFRPVREIIKTAEDISRDGDLSKRIESVRGRDEIHKLAVTFNGMFERLEKSFKEEKQFTADVSHELRTPLAVIISQSDYAKEDVGYREKALDTINREARRMSGLINKLLTLARSDSGRLAAEKEDLDFSEICESVAEQQRYLTEEKGIKFISEIEPGIRVFGDESMLMRILINLTDNAVKYGCENNGKDDRSGAVDADEKNIIKMTLKNKDGYACCTVEDVGPGIDEEHIERIWERFYRINTSRSDEGSGLGLSMVKALVKANGGEVKVDSCPGEGSKFTVIIPALEDKSGESK